MAHLFFVTIDSERHGRLKGDATIRGYEDKLTGYGYEYSIDVPNAQDGERGAGRARGRPQRSLVSFVTRWHQSSPLLLDALLRGDRLDVSFEFCRPDTNRGGLIPFYTIRLEHARVAHLRDVLEAVGGAQGSQPEYQEVGLTFEQMEVTWMEDGTTAIDDARAGV